MSSRRSAAERRELLIDFGKQKFGALQLYDVPPEIVHIPWSEGVVSLDYKYLRYIDSNPLFEELYDLKNDPYETKNLKNDPLYENVLDSMRIRLKEFRNLYK